MNCPFCERLLRVRPEDRNDLAAAFPDAYPVSRGHTLVVPLRHGAEFFQLSPEEQTAMWRLVETLRRRLEESIAPDGFNIGINAGGAAGQTIGHAHIHVIPRFVGDIQDPRGGIRWVLPAKARYW
jgi:diadenosine tetraphosphate (Ap4A) HIT family hydrolase